MLLREVGTQKVLEGVEETGQAPLQSLNCMASHELQLKNRLKEGFS